MATIYKYPVEPSDDIKILMPVDAQIINASIQGDQPCIWAIVDPSLPMKIRRFIVVPTGGDFDERNTKYVGTFHGINGWMVFHLFEIISK